MNKKDYIAGLVTGVVGAIFITVIVVCVRIIMSEGKEAQQTDSTGSGASIEGLTAEEYANSILSNPEVLRKIATLEEVIRSSYIDEVTDEQLANGLYSGIMDAIDDPYAEYYTPEGWIEMQQHTQGIYYGIGAFLRKDEVTLYPLVTGVVAESPAEGAGLQEGDLIIGVDGEDVYDQNLTEVVMKIRGEDGTRVHLEILREQGSKRETIEYDIVRSAIETPTVESKMLEGDIGYIQIVEFETATINQFRDAYDEVRANHAKALIIDLRGNPGGTVNSVVEIGRMLLPEGRIVYTEDKYGNQTEYTSDGTNVIDIPLVVLVNGNSASASEILSGAIKDYGVGVIMGTTTFGKGIVQQLFRLSDGSAVKLTVSHYYTPLGNDIHKIGIEPDIEVEWDYEAYEADGTDNQLDAAVEYLLEQIGK